MNQVILIKNIDNFILEISSLLEFIKTTNINGTNDSRNILKEECFEKVKKMYFTNIKKWLTRKYPYDKRRLRIESVLEWANTNEWIWEWYLVDIIELVKQFKYEVVWMSNFEFNSFTQNPYKKTKNYWKIFNPMYWILLLIKLWWDHKVISFIILTIIGTIIVDSIKPLTELVTKPISTTLSWNLNK